MHDRHFQHGLKKQLGHCCVSEQNKLYGNYKDISMLHEC